MAEAKGTWADRSIQQVGDSKVEAGSIAGLADYSCLENGSLINR